MTPRPSRTLLMSLVLPLLMASIAPFASADPDNDDETAAVDQLFAAPPPQPMEAGVVPWRRNWDAAVEEAKASGKPLFVQFQEVPG